MKPRISSPFISVQSIKAFTRSCPFTHHAHLKTLCTPHSTVPHLWVLSFNPCPPSPLTRSKFHNHLNQLWIKSSHSKNSISHLTCGSPDSLSCPAGWTAFSSHHQRFSHLPREQLLPALILRSPLQVTTSLSTVFRLLPSVSPDPWA